MDFLRRSGRPPGRGLFLLPDGRLFKIRRGSNPAGAVRLLRRGCGADLRFALPACVYRHVGRCGPGHIGDPFAGGDEKPLNGSRDHRHFRGGKLREFHGARLIACPYWLLAPILHRRRSFRLLFDLHPGMGRRRAAYAINSRGRGPEHDLHRHRRRHKIRYGSKFKRHPGHYRRECGAKNLERRAYSLPLRHYLFGGGAVYHPLPEFIEPGR